MKKLTIKFITATVLVCSFIASIVSARPANAGNVTVSLSPATGSFSSYFTIKVMATGTDIAGFEMVLPYDSSTVSVSSLSKGSGISSWTELTKSTGSGMITYDVAVEYSSPQPASGTVELASIRFTPRQTGTLTLAFSSFVAYDSDGNEHTVTHNEGEYTITGVVSPSASIVSPVLRAVAVGVGLLATGLVGIVISKGLRSKYRKWYW